ncbi:MAG: hypothetical protein ABSE63_03115, partial [Thermoguttaceae bacterium]
MDFFSGRNLRKAAGGRNRRLMIDPLEERMLLTVTTSILPDQLVNQTPGIQGTGTTSSSGSTVYTSTQSVATDNNGDFVVAWTRYDQIFDPEANNGLGGYVQDANIYARYYTDEVQRIVLPVGATKFSLVYGGNSVQKISFSTVSPIAGAAPTNIQGVFKLALDVNGDGYIDPLTEVSKPINFNETQYTSSDPALNPAYLMQQALQSLGGAAEDVQVKALGPRDYEVDFGDASQGQAMSLVQIQEPAWTSGYLPGYEITSLRTRTDVGILAAAPGVPRILVSPTNPADTAMSIQSAFDAALGKDLNGNSYVKVAPVIMPGDDPQGLRTFDITFVGDMGKTDQPQMLFGQIYGSDGKPLTVQQLSALNTSAITTMKEPGPEFRVNPPEPDNPYTIGLDLYDQTSAAVAMDPDGDFVITWQSVVPDSVTPGSKTDIFAERFSPAALINLPNLVISNDVISVPEGSSNFFTVKLASKPTSAITVNVAKESGTEDPSNVLKNVQSTLTFTPANWDQAQNVTITSDNDTNNTNETAIFDVSITGIVTQTVTATQVDSNSIRFSTDNLYIPEGSTNTFTVWLGGKPASNVTVNIAKLAGGDADLTFDTDPITLGNQNTLTFTSSNWNTPQTVKVAAKEDADMLNGTATLSATATGYTGHSIILTEIDNDAPSIILSVNDLSVQEGGSNSFTVSLSAAPITPLYVSILKRADGDRDINVTQPALPPSPPTLFFNAFNWNSPQTITLSADLDTDIVNGTAYFYVGESQIDYVTGNFQLVSDSAYAVQTVAAHEIDVPRLVVSTTDVAITEDNPATLNRVEGTNFFTVALASQPTSNVTVTVSKAAGSDPSIKVNAAAQPAGDTTTLNFTPFNWNTPQRVTVSGQYDKDYLDGTALLMLYAKGYAPEAVTVEETDLYHDPIAGLIVSSVNVAVPEGSTNTFTIALNSAPTLDADGDGTPDDVTITITPVTGNDPDLTISPITLTFSADKPGPPVVAGNWNASQPVTITSKNDADNLNGIASWTITSSDPAHYGPVTVNATEIDTFSIVVSRNLVPVLEGRSNTFSVHLGAQPTGSVTVSIAQDVGDADLTLPTDPTRLTFTPDNWNVDQTVTIDAARDADSINGTRDFLVTANRYSTQIVTAMEIDTPDLVITPTEASILEGTTGTFTVALPAAPTGQVVVDIIQQPNGDPSISADKTSLTFTPANWSTPQTVTVTAAADPDDSNGISSFLLTSSGYAVGAFTAISIDKDASPVLITSDNISVPEGGFKFVDVKLSYQPIADVTVTIAPEAGGDADLAAYPTTLTFTSKNWNQTQRVVFSAAQDADAVNGSAVFDFSSA